MPAPLPDKDTHSLNGVPMAKIIKEIKTLIAGSM